MASVAVADEAREPLKLSDLSKPENNDELHRIGGGGLDESQAGIKIAQKNINNLRYADGTALMPESEEELKSLLMRVKEESEKNWLKIQHSKNEKTNKQTNNEDHGIQCHHFMQIDVEKVETMTDFIFLGSKITADNDCSHEIERHLLFGRKAMTNLDSVFKSRHYFANKGSCSQSYGFSSSHVQT